MPPRRDAEPVRIRTLNLQDLGRILEIDHRLTKVRRKAEDNDLWRLLAESTTSFGAEVGGRLVGFVLADARPWEFGSRSPVGWVIALGVEPEHQHRGLGRMLGVRVLGEFQRLGVTEVKTLVQEGDQDLRRYFTSLGFRPAREAVLRLGGTGRGKRGPKASSTRRSQK